MTLKEHVAMLENASAALSGLKIVPGAKVRVLGRDGAILARGTVARVDAHNNTFEIDDDKWSVRIYPLTDLGGDTTVVPEPREKGDD